MIKIFRQAIKDFNRIGDDVQQLYYDFVVVQIRFETWAETYGLDNTSTTTALRRIWGRRGSESISLQLISLDKVMDRFHSTMALLLSEEVLEVLDPNIQNHYSTIGARPATLAKKISHTSLIASKVKKVMTTEEKLDFLQFGSNELSKDLEETERRLAFLLRDAEILDKRRNESSGEISLDTQGLDEIPDLLRIAIATKDASNALFTSCFAAPRQSYSPMDSSLTNYFKLEMKLRNEFQNEIETSNPQALQFHFLLARPQIERPLEILVTGPINWIEEGQVLTGEQQRDFLDACEAVMNNIPCEFTAAFHSQLLRFRSCLPRDLIPAEQQSFMPLSILFQELRSNRSSSFLLSEKIDLAFQSPNTACYFSGLHGYRAFDAEISNVTKCPKVASDLSSRQNRNCRV